MDSLEALATQRKEAEDAEPAKQGEDQKLAEQAQAKAAESDQKVADARARLHSTLTQSAIVSEAAKAGAVDPAVVAQLLEGKSQVGENDAISIGGDRRRRPPLSR